MLPVCILVCSITESLVLGETGKGVCMFAMIKRKLNKEETKC